MRTERRPSRRLFLRGAATAAGGLLLAGCDPLSQSPGFRKVLYTGEDLTMLVQRALLSPSSMAREFPASAISTDFKANGSTDPDDATYRALAANGFADWQLEVGGLVERPASYSLADLRAMPARSQITRHDCVEGWSCIGKWTGVQLASVLAAAGLQPKARYILFTCADELEKTLDGSGRYYETIDLEDAFHPQTILAYDMNDEALPIAHGAPLRARVERQLGYKMAKYVMRIDAIEDFASLGRGQGSFWADRGYDWYAGI
jgi:DMSO/TMAO reductase YedYZ molybdopterin-dependent catalytic subunit